jgi:hypothetical protein
MWDMCGLMLDNVVANRLKLESCYNILTQKFGIKKIKNLPFSY